MGFQPTVQHARDYEHWVIPPVRRECHEKRSIRLMLVIKVMSTIPCPCGGLISIVRFNSMGRFGLRLLNQKNKQTSKNKDQPEKKNE